MGRQSIGRLLRSTQWGSALLQRPELWALRLRLSSVPHTMLPTGDALVVSDGLELELPPRFARHYLRFEPLTLGWLKSFLRNGATVVNVGAHVGFVTLVAAREIGREGTVFAIEPAEENLHYLRRNLRRNTAENVVVLPFAAGASNTSREFHITHSSDSHGFYEHPNTRTSRIERVEQIRLDDRVDHADLVTIDVEGAELEVLAGMSTLIERRTTLLVEWAPDCQRAAGRGQTDLIDALRQHDYRLSVIDDVHGKMREVEEVVADLAHGNIQPGWYGNLICDPA